MSSFLSLTFLLACCYLICFLLVVLQIALILYYRHNAFGFQSGFLSFCFLWTICRLAFWLNSSVWPPWAALSIYWIPINIQFSTFSLLVVFYANVVHKATWDGRKKKVAAIVYILVNLSLYVLTISWVAVISTHDSPDLTELYTLLSGIVFLLLSAVLAFYAWKLARLEEHEYSKKLQMPFKPKTGVFFNLVYFVVFASRCVYNMISTAGYDGVRIPLFGTKEISPSAFFFFLWWEIVPTFMVLIMIWKIPKTHIGVSQRKKTTTLPLIYDELRATEASDPQRFRAAHLFDNPRRYDSDDDGSIFRSHFGTPLSASSGPAPAVALTGMTLGKAVTAFGNTGYPPNATVGHYGNVANFGNGNHAAVDGSNVVTQYGYGKIPDPNRSRSVSISPLDNPLIQQEQHLKEWFPQPYSKLRAPRFSSS